VTKAINKPYGKTRRVKARKTPRFDPILSVPDKRQPCLKHHVATCVECYPRTMRGRPRSEPEERRSAKLRSDVGLTLFYFLKDSKANGLSAADFLDAITDHSNPEWSREAFCEPNVWGAWFELFTVPFFVFGSVGSEHATRLEERCRPGFADRLRKNMPAGVSIGVYIRSCLAAFVVRMYQLRGLSPEAAQEDLLSRTAATAEDVEAVRLSFHRETTSC
jgi:hypothetical protein